jgi:hypothetical protein
MQAQTTTNRPLTPQELIDILVEAALDAEKKGDDIREGTEENPKPVGGAMIFLDSIRRFSPRRPIPALKPTIYYVPVVSATPLCPECAGPLSRARSLRSL